MFENLFKKNSIKKITKVMPFALVKAMGNKRIYSVDEVSEVFSSKFKYDHNIEYAFAMFCSAADFKALNLGLDHNKLRNDVAKKCFGSWPHFTFKTLLNYSFRSQAITFNVNGGYNADGSFREHQKVFGISYKSFFIISWVIISLLLFLYGMALWDNPKGIELSGGGGGKGLIIFLPLILLAILLTPILGGKASSIVLLLTSVAILFWVVKIYKKKPHRNVKES